MSVSNSSPLPSISVIKMISSRKDQILVRALCLGFLASIAGAGERVKRELRFPKGGSLVAGVALASLLPKGPTDGFAHVLEFDLGFPFPEKFSIGKKEALKKINRKFWYKSKVNPRKKTRMKRNLKEKQREDLLLKLEGAFDRTGFNGFSCVSRFQCELRKVSPPNSLLERLLLSLFNPVSKPEEKNCEKHISSCQISLLQIILHSEQISSPQST